MDTSKHVSDVPASARHGIESNPKAILDKLRQLLDRDADWTGQIEAADQNGEATHIADLTDHRADERDSIAELLAELDAMLRAGAPIPTAWSGPQAAPRSYMEDRLCTVEGTPHAHVTEELRDAHNAPHAQPSNADHLIGESITAPSADHYTRGEPINGVIAGIEATTADGDVVALLESGYRVTVSNKLVEMTRPQETPT